MEALNGGMSDDLTLASGIRRGNTVQQQLADAINAYRSEIRSQPNDDENVTMVSASPTHVRYLGISREQIEALKAQAAESGEEPCLIWNKEDLEEDQ